MREVKINFPFIHMSNNCKLKDVKVYEVIQHIKQLFALIQLYNHHILFIIIIHFY